MNEKIPEVFSAQTASTVVRQEVKIIDKNITGFLTRQLMTQIISK